VPREVYDEKDRPKVITDEYGLKHTEGVEPVENITTRGYSRKAVFAPPQN
jgi:hypothetical protein